MINQVLANAFRRQKKISPLHRPSNQFRNQTDAMLREMAYVLQVTSRVKDKIMAEREEAFEV